MMQMQASRVAESAAKEEMVVVVLIMICCVFFIIAGVGAAWFGQGKKGDKCKGPVENAKYELDKILECQYLGCNEGYGLDGTGTCVLDQSGKDCQGSITNAIYETDISNVCVFMTCNYGYQIDDSGACVKIEEGGAGAEAGGLTSYVPTSETPTTNATPTVLTGGELTTVETPVTTPTNPPAENVGSYTPATDPNAIDADTWELADVANEDNYSLAESEYYWYKYYNYHKIVWNGEVIAVFIEPNYDFGVGQNKIEDGGDIATIGYYEKDGYAYHRWPQYQTDGGYAQGITNNTYTEFKLIKTLEDPSKTQPVVNYNVADYSRYAR